MFMGALKMSGESPEPLPTSNPLACTTSSSVWWAARARIEVQI
jgi:hypothetical protein